MDYSSFPCVTKECSGLSVAVAKDGRFYVHPVHKWCFIAIPASMKIHRCTVCGTDWLTRQVEDVVNAYIAVAFEEHRAMILDAMEKYKKRQTQLDK